MNAEVFRPEMHAAQAAALPAPGWGQSTASAPIPDDCAKAGIAA